MPPALPVLPVQPKVQDCASPVWAVSDFRIGLGSRGEKMPFCLDCSQMWPYVSVAANGVGRAPLGLNWGKHQ